MAQIKLSIIIPVYNVERYIEKCLMSCLNQDIPSSEYEIIVINDGSPDNSLLIAERIAKEHSNIKIYSRTNGGLSAARNTGLQYAQGEYVWFVDSDDWIEENCINKLVNYASVNILDVLCFNLFKAFEDGTIIKFKIKYNNVNIIYNGESFVQNVEMSTAAWAAIYKREYLMNNQLFFQEGIIHEDQEFTPRAYCIAKRIAYVDEAFYYYLHRKGSIMRCNQNSRRCKDLLIICDSLYKFAKSKLVKETIAYQYILKQINFNFSQSLSYYNREDFDIDVYRNKEYYPLNLNGYHLKSKVKYLIINISIKLYLLIYQITHKKI